MKRWATSLVGQLMNHSLCARVGISQVLLSELLVNVGDVLNEVGGQHEPFPIHSHIFPNSLANKVDAVR